MKTLVLLLVLATAAAPARASVPDPYAFALDRARGLCAVGDTLSATEALDAALAEPVSTEQRDRLLVLRSLLSGRDSAAAPQNPDWRSWREALRQPASAARPDDPATAKGTRAHFERSLRAIADPMDRGAWSEARRIAMEEEVLVHERIAIWSAALADSARLTDFADSLFAQPAPALAVVDSTAWVEAKRELVSSLLRGDTRTPSVESAIRTRALEPPPLHWLALSHSERVAERGAAGDLQVARRQLAVARHELDQLEAEIASRLEHRERGEGILADAIADLDSLLGAMRDLDRLAPEHLEALRRIEAVLVARIEQRTTNLRRRVVQHGGLSRALHHLYPEGPMGRRDPAPREGVPVEGDLLRGEDAWAEDAVASLDSLRTGSDRAIRRSFSGVFAQRLGPEVRDTLDRVVALRASADSMSAGLREEITRLRSDPRLERLRIALTEADSRMADATTRWRGVRQASAQSAIERALADQTQRGEALAYSLAVSTTEVALQEENDALQQEARDRWAAFLQRDGDPRVRGDARYRWADLELVLAQKDFQERMGEWLQDGSPDTRRLAPLLEIDLALDLYRSILDEDLAFARRDLVLRNLGMLEADRGDPDAAAHLARLTDEHPDSPHRSEAQLRLGELRFDAEDFRGARAPLRDAALRGDADVRAVALYKLGWSAHRSGDFAEAIESFAALLDQHLDPATRPSRFDLEDESRELLLRSLARDGGADAFARYFADGDAPYAADLLDDLARLLDGYALDLEAEKADQLLLARYPLHRAALDAALRSVARREADPEAQLALARRFRADQDWAAGQPDSLASAGDRFAREALVLAVQRGHEDARGGSSSWRSVGPLYDELILHWPGHEDLGRWHLLAGEVAREVDDYETALGHFARAQEVDDELASGAAWQAIHTADAWYSGSAADSVLARRFLATADPVLLRAEINATQRSQLSWRLLDVSLEQGWDEEVAMRADALAQDGGERVEEARRLKAEALYRLDRFESAATAFREIDVTTASDSLRQTTRGWVAHCLDRHAEQLFTGSQALEAAVVWRDLAAEFDRYSERDRALYRSADAFLAGGEAESALERWAELLDSEPESALRADTHRNRIALLEDRERWSEAAEALLAFTSEYPTDADASASLLHAADLFELAGDTTRHESTLDLHLERHPDDLDTTAWVLAERARAELDGAGEGAAVARLLAFDATDPDLVPDELLARIGFERAELLTERYTALALAQPLATSLATKRDGLTEVLAAYREVAEYGVSPWSQGAAHRIGAALVHLADALRASERPAGLSGDDALAYDEVLEEQAQSFESRGESAWQELLRNAREDDQTAAVWIAATRAQLFPRTAQRFLHRPAFDYPVLAANPGAHPAGRGTALAPGK